MKRAPYFPCSLKHAIILVIILFMNNEVIAGEIPPTPVHVAKAEEKDLPVTIKGSGHLTPYIQIKIKSRVNGKLEKVYVEDGAMVEKDQTLFAIDPAPYLLAVNQAEANLIRAQAEADEEQKLALTAKKLLDKEIIAKEKFEKEEATAAEAKAMVKVAEAELATAKQNLSYCKITAPISGMLGRKQLFMGSLVEAYQDVIITLNTIDKLKATFSLPAAELQRLRQEQSKNKLQITVYTSEEPAKELTGNLTYIANEISDDTGMFEVQGVFDNNNQAFWPGQYIQATIILRTRPNSVVIPYRALFNGEKQSKMVYVVLPDNTVEARQVELGWRVDTDAVILTGLKKNDTVVTEGLFKLYPKAKVTVIPEKK